MGQPRAIDNRKLVDVAMGRLPADLVIENGQWVCVQSGEVIPGTSIAIKDGRIALVCPDASYTISEKTRVIDAGGQFLVPGLLDGHIHIESGMLTITEFVRAVIAHGTTGVFIDPHEIANVLGLKGVRLMVDEAAVQPIHVWVQIPSCVPSAPGLETPGASLGPDEIAEALQWDGIVGLGEVMNFPGVYLNDDKMHAEMVLSRKLHKVIGGHYASPDLGMPFYGYVAGGAEDDHEGTRLEDGMARIRQGMKAMLRYGSGWQDVATQAPAITQAKLDPRHFILVTDDAHSETFVNEGHMDRVIRHAIQCGIPPVTAIQMATLNTAEHFKLSHEVGLIAAGRSADILLVPDLVDFQADLVISRGEVVAEKGRVLTDIPAYAYPAWATSSIKLPRPVESSDFRITTTEAKVPPGSTRAIANVIGIIENQAPTRLMRIEVDIIANNVRVDKRQNLATIAVVERHTMSGRIQKGLVHGFGFNRPCAVATSVAHDSHNIVVVGTDESCMAQAVNELAGCGGGQVVVCAGEDMRLVELPVAGLMSNENAMTVAHKASSILEGFKACGCQLNNPNMQLSLLALVVIPEIRISDLGLVDVTKFQFTPLLEPIQ